MKKKPEQNKKKSSFEKMFILPSQINNYTGKND